MQFNHAVDTPAAAYRGQAVVDTKNEAPRKAANRIEHAVQCARQRDQWSSELAKAREDRHLAELQRLRQQVTELGSECDALRRQARRIEMLQQQIVELASERDAARRQAALVEKLQQQITELTSDRDAARRQAALVEKLQQQITELTSDRDAARGQARVVETLRQQVTSVEAERDAARGEAQRVETLGQQLNDVAAQRDAAGQRVKTLETSLATTRSQLESVQRQVSARSPVAATPEPAASPSRLFNRVATAAGVVLSLGVLASVATFQNAQSTVQTAAQTNAPGDEDARFDALETEPVAAAEEKKPPPQTKNPRTRFAKVNRAGHRQWGPALLLTEPQPAKAAQTFDPLVKQLQTNLLTLGFDLGKADGFNGPRTEQALSEFEALYLSGANLKEPPSRTALAAITKNYADLARDDATNFNVDRGVLAAIRLSSVRTGVEFSYLMKLAAVESDFDPLSEATGSSATGLYQFTRETWLNTVKSHGDSYGLEAYTKKINYYIDRDGNRRPVVRDKTVYKHLLELRKNPRVSAMMAAESVKDNVRKLTRSFDRAPSQADLYLTHFLGPDGAISFLRALNDTPDALAVDMFPAAAQSNQDIFHPKTCKPRTVDEVYELFGEKFSALRYDLATN
jgi:uncharacterized coiled-coil DUF342 family protein